MFMAAILMASFVTTAAYAASTIPATTPDDQPETHKITLGAVQSKIKVGVSGDEVIMALGSPNIITSGDGGTETWVYDKLSVEQDSSARVVGQENVDPDQTTSSVNMRAAVKHSSTERTMMVIVKFDSNKKVSSVHYRESTY
jgi:outer membrane protein assembly factor BamE (lipoprotein component of BamABCDE complex)